MRPASDTVGPASPISSRYSSRASATVCERSKR